MTIRHHKGELLRNDGEAFEYRYFPDHVEEPLSSGVFRVSPSDWSFRIVTAARPEGREPGSSESECIRALIHQLKKAHVPGAPPPEALWFIA